MSHTVSPTVTSTVSSGDTASDYLILSGGTLRVLSGGTAVQTTVQRGGVLLVSGGTASATTLYGSETISAGGLGVAEVISVGGSERVSSGGTISSDTLSGGTETLLSGAVAIGTVVKKGSLLVSGGTTSMTQIASGGGEILTTGVARDEVISGGFEDIGLQFSTGVAPVASGTLIEMGGVQNVAAGAVYGATVGSGGTENFFGGTASGVTVSGGGSQFVGSASFAVNDVVLAGGTVVDSGLLRFTEAAGSSAILDGRLTGPGEIVNSGPGTLVLAADVASSGATDPGFTGPLLIEGGTVELTGAGAAGTGIIVLAAGNSATLRIDGTAMPTNTISGFLQGDAIDLAGVPYGSGGTATVSGNTVTVAIGGADYALTIAGAAAAAPFTLTSAADGGTLLTDARRVTFVSNLVTSVVASGVAPNEYIVLSGGTVRVLSGGAVNTTMVMSGGNVLLSGTAGGTVLSGGGTETIFAGGTGTGETIGDGGLEIVSAGGMISGNIVDGGTEELLSASTAIGTLIELGSVIVNGTASASVVTANATLLLLSGRTVSDIVSGGIEQVGVAAGQSPVSSDSIVEAGGVQVVSAGTAIRTVVSSGGEQTVVSSVVSGTVVSSGGTQFVYSGVAVDDVVLSGGLVTDSGRLLFTEAEGTSIVLGGTVQGAGMVWNSGLGTLVLGAVAEFSGGTEIQGGTVELMSAAAAGTGSITFADGILGKLRIDDAQMPSAPISGLAPGDIIDLSKTSYASTTSVSLTTGNVLLISETQGQTTQLQLDRSQDFTGKSFHLSQEAGGSGTLISETGVPCYCLDTRIRTARGDVAVERLRVGDLVVTRAGPARPVIWIGRRSYGRRFVRANAALLPIRIAAGALAEGVPARDLYVSRKHAMFLDDVLIPAELLVNGRSIVRVQEADDLCYFHIELASHDVIFAEGAPSESYLDCDNRLMFQNAHAFTARPPQDRGAGGAFCARRVEDGAVLQGVNARLLRRADALGLAAAPAQTVLLGAAGIIRAIIPAGAVEVRFLSTSTVPTGERRRLGAAFAGLTLDGMSIDLDDARFGRGFHATERDAGRAWRWTDGDASLQLDPAVRPRVLVIDVVSVRGRPPNNKSQLN